MKPELRTGRIVNLMGLLGSVLLLLWGSLGAGTDVATRPVAAATQPAARPPIQIVVPAGGGVNIQLNGPVAPGAWGGNPAMKDALIAQQMATMDAMRGMTKNAKEGGTYKIDDLLRITLVDGMIDVQTTPLADAIEGNTRIKVVGLTDPLAPQAIWTLNLSNARNSIKMAAASGAGRRSITLSRYNFDQKAEGQIWINQFVGTNGTVTMSCGGMGQSVSYRQQGNAVHLTIVQQLAVNGAMPLQLSAPTLPELQAAYPQEVRHYLSPIFVRLFGRDLVQPGAGDVYSVFSEIPPAPQAQAAVQALLGPLDADAFEQRQAASDELGKLGVPGVLAVLRLDRSKLTQEQKSRCDAFVQTQRHRSIDDPQEARRDPNFLIDALNDDDPAVRAAAKSALEAVVGHAIPFDVSQDAATRQTAIAALEEQVQKELAKTPATLPAAQPQPR